MTLLPVALAAAVAASPQKIATLDLEASGVAPELAHTLAVLLPNEVRAAVPEAHVISGEEIRNLLGFERQRQLLGCTAQASCLAEIGSALGAEELVGGTIGRVGRTYVLVLRRLDTRRGDTLASVTSSLPVDEEDRLLLEFRRSVQKLFGRAVPEPGVALEAGAPAVQPWKYGVLVGGAAALLAGGVVTVITASDYSSEQSKLQTQPLSQQVWSSDKSRIDTEARVADVLVVAGAVATGVGAWLVLHHDSVAVTPVASAGFVGGAVAGSF